LPGAGITAEPPVAAAPPPTAEPGLLGRYLVGAIFLAPAIRAFVKFLTTPAAAEAWAKLGGFATGNNKLNPSVYPDPITRLTAVPISKAKTVVFDMSDQQPGSFGATVGQGEWGLFQDFLRSPSNVNGIAAALEKSAAAAYKGK